MMVFYSFCIIVAALVLKQSVAENSTTPEPVEVCPALQTFNISQINGTWYEYKRTTDFLGKGVCTQYSVTCANNTYCTAQVIESSQKTNITIIAESENIVNASIDVGQNVMTGVHIMIAKDSALLWQCEPMDNETGLMYQASIWHVSNNTNDTQVESLLKYLPTVNWEAVNQTCPSRAKVIAFSFFNVLFVVISGYIIN